MPDDEGSLLILRKLRVILGGIPEGTMRSLKLVLSLLVATTMACRLGGNSQPLTDEPSQNAVSPASTPVPTEPASTSLQVVTGRNEYTVTLEGVPRTFIIYVPAGYDPNQPAPLVFMFHGSNQSGRIMYESTAWAQKAEAENFIVVFPTSWKYLLTESSRVEDKWNAAGLYRITAPGEQLKDDVGFVRLMIDQLEAAFNVDPARIYATGFSNGGGFVISRLMLEMTDVFAAFAVSGAAMMGEAKPDQIPTGINASLYAVLGSNDEKIAERIGYPLPFPVIAEEIMSDPLFSQAVTNSTLALSLDNSNEVVYEKPAFATLTFNKSLIGADNEFIFRMVKGMGHVYPSGDNNRAGLDVADLFWDFFQRHAK